MNIINKIRASGGPIKYIFGAVGAKAPESLRLQQEHMDLCRAAVLLKGYKWYEQNYDGENKTKVYKQPNPAVVEKFFVDVDAMEPKALTALVAKSIEQQIINMFKNIDSHLTVIEPTKERRHASQVIDDVPKNAALEDTLGFELSVRESGIYRAGEGVFIKGGEVCPGTVVALFPGVVHLHEFARREEYVDKLLPDDDFNLISRFDGHLIDARHNPKDHNNPFAMGHKVNHTPLDTPPNVIQIPFDFTDDPLEYDMFPKELRKYIPNKFFQPRTFMGTMDRSAYMHGMVLVACRPLKADDELFIDYRLNPEAEVPRWYRFFDKQGAERRWLDDNPLLGSITVGAVESEKGIFTSNLNNEDKGGSG